MGEDGEGSRRRGVRRFMDEEKEVGDGEGRGVVYRWAVSGRGG